ncbi:MAG: CBS domain-containing protein [archaeon]
MKPLEAIQSIKKRILVKNIMSSKVVNLAPDDSVQKAVEMMSQKNISAVVVIQKGLVGIITERDLVTRVLAKKRDPVKTKIGEVMTSSPIIIEGNAPILKAAADMKKHHVRKLIVMKDDEVIGIVSQTDIINNLSEIDNTYRRLLANPYLALVVIAVVIALYFVGKFIFVR